MAYPSISELPALLDKWARHYGYKRITLRTNVRKLPYKYSIMLMYKNGYKYYFGAPDIDTIKQKILRNKPKTAD